MDRLILNMHPKHKKRPSKSGTKGKGKGKAVAQDSEATITEKDKKQRMFPGLALPDQEWKPTADFSKDPSATDKEVDDLMSQLENVGGRKSRARPSAGDYMPTDGDERSPKRRRPNNANSPSPPRYDRRPSPPRGRNGYPESSNSRGRQGNGNVRPVPDEKPILYKIYNGRVSSIKDFGAFISLEGIAGRAEGTSPLKFWLSAIG